MSEEKIFRLDATRRVAALRRQASMVELDEQASILGEISRILNHQDVELLLSLSVRSFHLEDEALAAEYLEKAIQLEPCGHAVLRVKAFLSLASGASGWQLALDELLTRFPFDDWAKNLRDKALAGDTSSISLPNVYGAWGLD